MAYRPVRFPERAFAVERRPDGSILVESRLAPPAPFRPVTDLIDHWSSQRPGLMAIAERGPDDAWRGIDWSGLSRAMRTMGEMLLERGLGPARPLMVGTPNSVDVGVLTFAALHVGIPLVPVSPMTFSPGASAERQRALLALVQPGLLVLSRNDDGWIARSAGIEVVEDAGAALVREAREGRPNGAADRAHAALRPESLGKILFTSGSAGAPKAVPHTQGMIDVARQMSALTAMPGDDQPPVYVEWMPWHHVMGGNIALHRNLTYGGTFHIDAGKPVPAQFATTLKNLRDVSPSSYASVPAAFAMLITEFERDHDLARAFFRRLWCMIYGGAALSPEVFARFNALTESLFDERIAFCAGYGATESCGPSLSQYWPAEIPDLLGLPLAGLTAKMVPVGGRFELRLKGANIFSGYVDDPDPATRFDDEGFYRTGDAVVFDDADLAAGIRFNGRLSENFKLATGTWVDVGALRLKLIDTLAPLVTDAVICGENRADVRALVWPAQEAIGKLFGRADWRADPALRARLDALIRERLIALAARGSSASVTAVRVLSAPPSARDGEINDKGYVNQRRCLETRAADVAALYARDPDAKDPEARDPARNA